jgi:hypothetical protein
VSYGDFLYANLPIEIGPLQGDGITEYEFGILDLVHSECGNATAIDPVSCDGETAFTNFTTQVVSCNNEMYELQMNFEVTNGGSEGFVIVGNGEEYGLYDYTQLPVTIGPLNTDGTTPYYFIAKDKEFDNCGNWDKLIPFTCESLGIGEEANLAEMIKVFPNPSPGSVTFENSSGKALKAFIYNSAGAEVSKFSFNENYKLNTLDAGIYYYRIIGQDGKFTSGKLIVAE